MTPRSPEPQTTWRSYFADTFNRYFERENPMRRWCSCRRLCVVLPSFGRFTALCCGRTFLGRSGGRSARGRRTLAALAPLSRAACQSVSSRDCAQLPKGAGYDQRNARQLAANALTFEEFLAREAATGRLKLPLKKIAEHALVHGHCHQKAFDAFSAVEQVLKLVPDLKVETIESSCCGMAGAFGYGADTIDVSLAMGELSLLPAVRKAPDDAIIVADGTSCRHQSTCRARAFVARVL